MAENKQRHPLTSGWSFVGGKEAECRSSSFAVGKHVKLGQRCSLEIILSSELKGAFNRCAGHPWLGDSDPRVAPLK